MKYKTVDRFFGRAEALRAVFDKRFENPHRAHAERFRWDYWHVPGEYTHLRTPAFKYFPAHLYASFHRYLVRWGREHLGCHDISPPWLSCYVEGCRQEIHQDVPHGPLAFVYSLTRWKGRNFRGGETFLTKPRTLISPEFNRLTLFDPSIPHGVREVRGTNDPREGRLVIHGWFVNPRPFWTGPLTADEVGETLDRGLASLDVGRLDAGFASYRLTIASSGRVTGMRALVRGGRELERALKALAFPRKSRGSVLTFPIRID